MLAFTRRASATSFSRESFCVPSPIAVSSIHRRVSYHISPTSLPPLCITTIFQRPSISAEGNCPSPVMVRACRRHEDVSSKIALRRIAPAASNRFPPAPGKPRASRGETRILNLAEACCTSMWECAVFFFSRDWGAYRSHPLLE